MQQLRTEADGWMQRQAVYETVSRAKIIKVSYPHDFSQLICFVDSSQAHNSVWTQIDAYHITLSGHTEKSLTACWC